MDMFARLAVIVFVKLIARVEGTIPARSGGLPERRAENRFFHD